MSHHRLALLLLLVAVATPGRAQDYVAREHYRQRLEPVDRILHGAGQDRGAFGRYWEAMPVGAKPIAYMKYSHLSSIGPDWGAELKRELEPFGDGMVVVQLGLELVGITETIPTGAYDAEIDHWLDGVGQLGLPVYARLGYEFNGLSWNGYQPAPYRAAFRYLADRIRERDLEIATVWNYVPDVSQPSNFMDYYPGDGYVDWWAVNFFHPTQIGSVLADRFLDSARVHLRPVMIGESTPMSVGVLDGQESWDAWFAPFFDLIASEPGIKMTGYINWNWADYPQWSTWGDARIEQNEVVRTLFGSEMQDTVYAHGGSERTFREVLGYTETVPPGAPVNLRASRTTWPLTMAWNPVDDPSGIARYRLYGNGELLDYTAGLESVLTDATPGELVTFTVSAVDRAGNEGPVSSPYEAWTPDINPEDPAEKLVNGEFDEGTDGWSLTSFNAGASGTLDIDSGWTMSGPNAAHVTITTNTGTNWHLQLQQRVQEQLEAGRPYRISYQVRSSAPVPVEVWLQQNEDPYTGYHVNTVNATPSVQTFGETIDMPVSDRPWMRFMLGRAGLAEVWVDAVSVRDMTPVSSTEPGAPRGAFNLGAAYPNPFTGSTTLEYSLSSTGTVLLEVVDVLGRRVNVLVDSVRPPGPHAIRWSPAGLPSGLYFARLSVDGTTVTRPLMIAR